MNRETDMTGNIQEMVRVLFWNEIIFFLVQL